MTQNLIYKIALSLIPGIGSITAKSLIAYTGSAEQVFREKENALRQIPGVGTILAKNIINSEVMSRAGREVEFLQKNNVKALFYLDEDYPQRLLGCPDAPIILNVKADPFLNCPKVISIVGTRHATEYGRKIIDQFISVLADRGYKIVVESAKKGGALVTADIANSYNRDVFAFPGKVGDLYSEGCHFLIKSNRAVLIESVADMEYMMNWSAAKSQPDAIQPCLFYDFNPDEKLIVDLLRNEGEAAIDLICIKTTLPMNKVSPLLLNLEFAGIVKGLPGKVFKAI